MRAEGSVGVGSRREGSLALGLPPQRPAPLHEGALALRPAAAAAAEDGHQPRVWMSKTQAPPWV